MASTEKVSVIKRLKVGFKQLLNNQVAASLKTRSSSQMASTPRSASEVVVFLVARNSELLSLAPLLENHASFSSMKPLVLLTKYHSARFRKPLRTS